MKYKIVLVIILFPVFAIAQDTALVIKFLKDSVIQSTLGNGGAQIDIREYNQFKDKFIRTAMVADNFNVVYRYDSAAKNKGSYSINSRLKPFDVYAHDVALKVRNIKFDSVSSPVLMPLNGFEKGNVYSVYRKITFNITRQYLIESYTGYINDVRAGKKSIEFDNNITNPEAVLEQRFKEKIDKTNDSIYRFTLQETLLITVESFPDGSIKITGIKNDPNFQPRLDAVSINNNDRDGDVILNGEDQDPAKAGDFTANGIIDSDLDGMPDIRDKCENVYVTDTSLNQGCPVDYFIANSALESFIGLQLNNAKINLPELNELGYVDNAGNNLIDVLQSEKGSLKNPGQVTGLTLGLNYAYYPGKAKKQWGISAGISYAAFKADYQLSSRIIYTYKSNDGNNDYRRQVKIDSLNEKITYNVFNFPLMVNYRRKFGNTNKFNNAINIKAGPSLLLFRNSSDYNAYASIGGIYQTSNGSVMYDNYFDPSAISNVFITADSINYQNANPGADEVFNQLRANADGYDFANNKNYQGKQKNLTRASVAFNAAVDAQFGKKGAPIIIKVGFNFVYAPLPERSEKYKPLDRTTDTFQSIYNSNAKSSYSAIGFNFGFVWNF